VLAIAEETHPLQFGMHRDVAPGACSLDRASTLCADVKERLWPYPRANGEDTIDVLRRLRAEVPERELIVLWDGAPYHRANAVREVASDLGIELAPLPGYSPDLMPVEALWRWLREDVTYHHCHTSSEDLTRRVAAFEARLNQNPFAIADRLWVKDQLNHEEEKLRFPK
jgi:transposase